MDKIDNIMALADDYADEKQISVRFSSGGFATTMSAQMEVINKREALRTAVTELASTATEYQQAAPVVVLKDAEPDKQLCKFYNVQTFPELVEQMERHIRKLQSQLPIRQVFTNSKVREG